MTKRKETRPEPPMEESVCEGDGVAGTKDSEVMNNHGATTFTLQSSGLKPTLDSIFSEVEKNLPEIDFELPSDSDTDDEQPNIMFHQHLKSGLSEEEKDLDTSQNSETMADLLTAATPGTDRAPDGGDSSVVDKNVDSGALIQLYDNDLAYEIQRSGDVQMTGVQTAWKETPDVGDMGNTANVETVSSWGSISQDKPLMDKNKLENVNNSYGNQSENLPKPEAEKRLTERDRDDRQLKRQHEREKFRTQEKDLVASSMVSPRAPVLATNLLDNIDFDTILQGLDDDNQLAPPSPRPAWVEQRHTESIYAAGEGTNLNLAPPTSGGMTLIQRLAQLSMAQTGEDLTDIDPCTGAPRTSPGRDNQAPDTHNVADMEDQESQVIEVGRVADSRRDKEEAAAVAGRIEDNILPKQEDTPSKQDDTRSIPDEAQFKQNETQSVQTETQTKEDDTPSKQDVLKKTASCGTNTSDFKPRILTARIPPQTAPPAEKAEGAVKPDKESTVFIDLRNFDEIREQQQQSIERVQQVLGIEPSESHSASSDSDDDMESWQRQRQKFKKSAIGHSSVLPNKPRDMPARHPRRVIVNADQRRPQTAPADVACTNQNAVEDVAARLRVEAEHRETLRRQELVRKAREQQENERQTKLRLQKRLEALKPSASVGGRHDAAECTPIVYDMDVSYEPSPRSLPVVLSPDQDCLLLNIHLSSNGEIVLHRGKGNKSVDTGAGLSASYTALLTWLLSLVPDNFTYLQEGSSSGFVAPWVLPFHVVGLQQVLLDDELSLIVAVTPGEQFDAKYVPAKPKKSKLRDEVKDTSPFHQHVSKFLSTNTLHTVCPWLQGMVSTEVTAANTGADTTQGYMYKPPLPNITTKPLSTFVQINPDTHAAAKVFNTAVGFFWQTVDNEEGMLDQELHADHVSYDTHDTMSLVYKKIYQDPRSMMGILNRILQEGLDLAGVRLLYPVPELINRDTDNDKMDSQVEILNNIGPVLALAIRGTLARSIWLDAVGPSDPALARRTDPNSLCALYGGESRDECLLFCPRNQSRVQSELARWFGGRVPPGNVIDVGAPYTRKDTLRTGSPKGRRGKKVTFAATKDGDGARSVPEPSSRPLATLTATTKSEIFLVLSPLVPPKCFGLVLASCQRRGYQLMGMKRCRLFAKRAASLGVRSTYVSAFCPGPASATIVPSFDGIVADRQGRQQEAASPATILQLQKENATHSAASLVEACMVQLTLQGIMGEIEEREGFAIESSHMFHAAHYSDGLLSSLGGDFSKCFDPEIQINPNFVLPQLYTNPELEQITVLLLLGHDVLKTCGIFVGKLLNVVPYSRTQQTLPFTVGLELLGMKWLPRLTPSQAKEVTPYEVGDRLWKDSLHTLTNEPCLILALRGVNAFAKLESVIPPRPKTTKADAKPHLDMLHSRSAEDAYSYTRQFFTEREMFADPLSRPMLPYIPHSSDVTHGQADSKKASRHLQTYPFEEAIFDVMLSEPKPLTTFLLVKPRAVQRQLVKILKKIVQEGFRIVGLTLRVLDRAEARQLVDKDIEEDSIEKHVAHLTSGPSLCLSLQRENSVKKLLDLLGPEDPQCARRHSQFYWRGVFGADSVANGFYASSCYDHAVTDQKVYFPDGLCCQETDTTQQLQLLCPAVDEEMRVQWQGIRKISIREVPPGGPLAGPHTLLLQTTCIVLTPALMRRLGVHWGYVDVMEGLDSQGFALVGARMVWFTQEQAEHFLVTVQAGSFQQVPLLTSGPSIVLALQRDNAVIAFDSLLRETLSTESIQGRSTVDSLLHKYGQLILRPSDVKQAHSLLTFFFHKLVPNQQVEILPVPEM